MDQTDARPSGVEERDDEKSPQRREQAAKALEMTSTMKEWCASIAYHAGGELMSMRQMNSAIT